MSAARSSNLFRSLLALGGFVVAMTVATAGCGVITGVAGSGPVTTEDRDVGAFSRVDAGFGINVTIRMGAAAPIEVHAQANLLPIVVTAVRGDTLRIRSAEEFNSSEPIEVEIVMPALDGLALSGSSRGTVTGFEGESLDVGLSGGTELTADGAVGTVNLEMSGGARADLDDLASQTVNLELSGGATTTVHASDEVSGSASGGAHVTVLGDPRVDVTTSGGAQVSAG